MVQLSIHLISSHLSPLTLEVGVAPQMTLQQYLSILPCLPLPSGNLQTPIPVLSLMLSSHLLFCSSPSCFFHCPLKNCLRHARWSWDVAIPSEFLYHGLEIIVHSNFILDSVANLLVRHMVFVGNFQKYPIASHLKGLNPSLDFCCQGPALTGIKKGR